MSLRMISGVGFTQRSMMRCCRFTQRPTATFGCVDSERRRRNMLVDLPQLPSTQQRRSAGTLSGPVSLRLTWRQHLLRASTTPQRLSERLTFGCRLFKFEDLCAGRSVCLSSSSFRSGMTNVCKVDGLTQSSARRPSPLPPLDSNQPVQCTCVALYVSI
jgi:hypothetical protein